MNIELTEMRDTESQLRELTREPRTDQLCGCVSVAGMAAQTWTTSARLVWLAAMTGDTEQHKAGTKVLL